MPIYEYECADCGKHTEHLQLSSDSPLAECPHCGGAVRKLMSAPAFQFKGSGWYVTDYAGKGKPSGSDEAKGATKDGSSGDSESKSPSKSADSGGAKTESKSSSASGAAAGSD